MKNNDRLNMFATMLEIIQEKKWVRIHTNDL